MKIGALMMYKFSLYYKIDYQFNTINHVIFALYNEAKT